MLSQHNSQQLAGSSGKHHGHYEAKSPESTARDSGKDQAIVSAPHRCHCRSSHAPKDGKRY
ncbi:hypothetical protein CH63R_14218 [Colletotrichum higginsianum IMI 349063]|uniref:Uncharacterized protein n=1 Tax=Colletotrichum higginsianum (strain IMI 349063) TaxID=759273 RepID=A0A1B7XTA9_COLHI|nr:hypothetical protein CH63R_14218 [Colletotrichum higginsianum IMI 349063]OBR02992.1 hypothetical protein CH63R_14218 [Colletotrichum higginsianum IMI 349063]